MKKKYIFLLFSFLFFIFLIWNLVVVDLYADEVWNYGFSYAIYRGLLPYHDFNMIITPLFPFVMAFFFYVFGFHILVSHIVNALILTFMSYIIYRLIDHKMWFVLLFLFLPLPNSYPSYNVFILFLYVLLLYMEKNQKNDFWIGVILGLSVLTKQSVGVCMALPSLYYFKDKNKIGKRLLGFSIPILIFIIYLLFSHTMMDFLDLCLFGLFDFTKNHSSHFFIYGCSLLYLGLCFYWIWKDKKNIFYYYALIMISMTIPLFDFYHFQISFLCLLLVFFMTQEIKISFKPMLLFMGILLGTGILQVSQRLSSGFIYPNTISHFEYRAISKEMIQYTQKMKEFMDEHANREIVFLTNNAYYLRIMNNEMISSVDLINNGNHGYHGNEKLMALIQNKKDAIFVVEELDPGKQTNRNVIQYVMNHGEKIDMIYSYGIYVMNHDYS